MVDGDWLMYGSALASGLVASGDVMMTEPVCVNKWCQLTRTTSLGTCPFLSTSTNVPRLWITLNTGTDLLVIDAGSGRLFKPAVR